MKYVHISLIFLMLVLSISIGALSFKAYEVLTKVDKDIDNVSAGLAKTLDNINRDCGTKVNGKLLPCGTLAEVNKATVSVGDIAKSAQIQVAQSNKVINSSVDTLTSVANHVNKEVDTLQLTTQAATGLIDQGTTTLATVNQGVKPILDNTNATVIDFDSLVKNPFIPETISNVNTLTLAAAGTTQNIQGISKDAKDVSDDLTKKYFAPEPWWKKIGPFAELGAKLGNQAIGVF